MSTPAVVFEAINIENEVEAFFKLSDDEKRKLLFSLWSYCEALRSLHNTPTPNPPSAILKAAASSHFHNKLHLNLPLPVQMQVIATDSSLPQSPSPPPPLLTSSSSSSSLLSSKDKEDSGVTMLRPKEMAKSNLYVQGSRSFTNYFLFYVDDFCVIR